MPAAGLGNRSIVPVLLGYSSAALLLPAATGSARDRVVAVAIAVASASLVAGRLRVARHVWLGAAIVVVVGWLVPQASWWATTSILGLVVGVGVGLVSPAPDEFWDRRAAIGLTAGAAQLGLLVWSAGSGGVEIAAVLYGLALLGASALGRASSASTVRRGGWKLASGGVLLTLVSVGWVGANSRTAAWFGGLVNHGSRSAPQVALTFDDGPDSRYTLEVRDILDRFGAKGTFFTVGKALVARPDISRALMSDGHLLGDHSYLHDSFSWLDPRYPELERTQRAFRRELGVCPTFFRPPHGQHTPFMARIVRNHGMTMVGWDVSAGDWSTHDPQLVARRVLRNVRPGSIIDLHDGLDGDLTADRSVLVRALPLILGGLRERGLRAVRLDRLLGRPGYGPHC